MTAKSSSQVKAPISAHPLFPAIVALWFAALLGVGSLVLPVVLFEKLAGATGFADAVPAAQPPLGMTARIVVALVAAGAGTLAGLAIARKVVAAQAVEAPRNRTPRPSAAKRPISAREELGSEGLDAAPDDTPLAPTIPGRRRPLSVTEEGGRSDFLEAAPLPGLPAYDAPAPDPDPLDLGEFAEPEYEPQDMRAFGTSSLSQSWSAPVQATPERVAAPIEPAREDPSMTERQAEFEPEPAADHHAVPVEAVEEPSHGERVAQRPFAQPPFAEPARSEPPRKPDMDGDVGERSLGELRMVELVERFALSLQRRATAEETVEALSLPPLKTDREPASPPAEQPVPFAEIVPPSAEAEESVRLDEPASEPVLVSRIPAALRPIGLDEEIDDEDDEIAPLGGLTLSLDVAARPFARPAPVAARPAPHADDVDDVGEDDQTGDEREGYSSLLAMKSPLGNAREFVRIDDDEPEEGAVEPVVVFPGHQQQRRATPASDGPSRDPLTHPSAPMAGFRPFDAPAQGHAPTYGAFATPAMPTRPPEQRADPGETERALRAALEKLQKMSGAA